MEPCGIFSSLTAKQYADEQYEIWKHLGPDECIEQIEAHMEQERYAQDEISDCINDIIYFKF